MKATKLLIALGFFALCFFVLGVNGVWAVDGAQKWAFDAGNKVKSSPAIGSDGTLYVGSYDGEGGGNLYAVSPDSTQKWVCSMSGVESSPAIGLHGTVYVGSYDPMGGGNLYAINPADGSKIWTCPVGSVATSPAIGADGTIYVGLKGGGLRAINPDGSNKWWFPTEVSYASPAIGSDGTIYFLGETQFYAINPVDGSQKWAFDMMGQYASPAISSIDGTVYIWGQIDGKLHAINPKDGSQIWSFKTGGGSSSSPAIGADGTIYVGSEDKNVYAVNPDGSQKWFFPTGAVVDSSPAIGSDGTVYVGSDNNNLYAINGSSGGLATKGWPMFHHDLRHTGSNAISPVPDIKANGHDGSISVPSATAVSIDVSLKVGSFAGQNADWWVLEPTPSGSFNHYNLSTGSMVPGLLPTHQGPLFNLGTMQLLNSSDLTVGTHTFYFGVDLDMNGTLDMDAIYYDSVNVTVQSQ